jgi:SlyX protein
MINKVLKPAKRMQNELIELQTQLSFQEQTIAELNAALTNQQQQLDMLRLEIKLLHEKIDESPDGVESSPENEKPPHY